MNLLDMLKEANIFSPTGATPQQFPVGSVGGPADSVPGQLQNQGIDLTAAIQGLLNPRDQAFENYQQMIQTMPQRQDYQPNTFQKIAGAIAGMGTGSPVGISGGSVLGFKSNIPEGLKAQNAIQNAPYERALSDWANKLEPTGKLAQMEQSRNVGNRATALGTLQRQQAQEKLDEQERANLEKESQGRSKLAIQQERADAYVKSKQFTLEHPEYKPFVNEDGDLFFYNPTDPTAKPVDSGLKKLSEMEKIDLNVQGELKKITARSEKAKELEGVKEGNRETLEGIKQEGRKDIKQTPTGNAAKPLTPSAERTKKQNKAIEIINQHPELKPYFAYGGNQMPTGELIPSKDTKDAGYAIAQRLMSEGSDISLGGDKSITIPPSQFNQSSRELARPSTDSPVLQAARKKLEPGYVLITRDGGKTFSQIPASNVNKLKPESGWVVVK